MKTEFSIWKDIYISALSTGEQALLLITQGMIQGVFLTGAPR